MSNDINKYTKQLGNYVHIVDSGNTPKRRPKFPKDLEDQGYNEFNYKAVK